MSGQCPDSVRTVTERCLESIWNRNFCTHIFCQAQSIWTVSGQCMDSVQTVCGQFLKGFGSNRRTSWNKPRKLVKLCQLCLDSVWTVSGQCPDSVWKVSGKYLKQTFLYTHFLPSSVYLDSVWTVCRQCVDSFWNVLDPPAGKVQTNLGNKSNYVKTVSGQCLNSIRTVSERCVESIWNRSFWTHIFCQAQSISTEINLIPIWSTTRIIV